MAKDALGHGSNARPNHREFAQHGLMHPEMASRMRVGQDVDFYEHGTGDKKFGRVTRVGSSIHIKEHKDGRMNTGPTHKFKISNHLPVEKADAIRPLGDVVAKAAGTTFHPAAMKKLSDSGAVIEKRKTRSDKGGHHKHKVGGMEFTSAHLPSMDDGETEMHGVYHNGKQIGSVEHYQGKHYAHSMHGNIGPGGKRMRSGAYDPGHPFESHEKAVEAIGLHHIHGEKMAAALREDNQRRAQAREHERLHGNENTGDISGLHEHMHVTGVDGNWVNGTTKDGRHSIAMKVFSEPSDYGLNRGRVSTLTVKNGKWGEPGGDHVNYDRGWDVKPSSEEHKQLVRGITNALKSKSVKKSDDGHPEDLDADPCEYVPPTKNES